MKSYLKKNWFSFLIGCIIGIPFSLYAVNHREPARIPVYYDPGLFEQFSVEPEHTEPVEQEEIFEAFEVYEITPDDLELEYYYDSLELLALCVEAEAGDQGLYGKKLVADVVLNRVDSPDFPDNITDVILQCGNNGVYQFSVVGDGRIYAVEPTEETFQAIREELESRTNKDILFFTAEGFSPYGSAWEKVGDHYFSTEKK